MKQDPRLRAEVLVVVPFHDVDMMGVVWHGNYARYFEVAREALLNQIGFGYQAMSQSGYAWPIVDMQVKYRKALRHEQRIRVRARIDEIENYLSILYEIRDAESGACLTKGYTRQVAVDRTTGEICLASPRILLEKMESPS